MNDPALRPASAGRNARLLAARLAGWLGAGIVIFFVTSTPFGVDLQRGLSAWAQRGPAYLPNAARQSLGPDQPGTLTPTSPPTTMPTAVTPATSVPPPAGPDALAATLGQLGLSRADLGYRPRGDWTRYPLPSRTSYLLPFFGPLLESPLRAYDASRTMGNAADRWLRPDTIGAADSLMRAAYYLGGDRKVGNFRDYAGSANLHARVAPSDALRVAINEVYRYARTDTAYYSFGGASTWKNAEERIGRELAVLSPELQAEIAAGVSNLLDAVEWRDRALRRVPKELARQVFAIRDLGESQGDGTIYYPEIDDLMASLDEPSLYYSARKLAETAQALRIAVAGLPRPSACPTRMADFPTPFGRIVVGTCGPDTFAGDDVLLLVDPGGDDRHLDNAGGTSRLELPVAASIDVAGDDTYDCSALTTGGCQGAGILGNGILLDGAGTDTYAAWTHAQGAGFIGQGLLADLAGADQYDARFVAQGAGFFGHGLLVDGNGSDRYRLWWDGQGYGGVGGGVGVIADYAGDDHYFSEPDVRKIPVDYQYRNYAGNGQPNTVVSFAQGASAGRRGDGSDGHSWPGGLGALVDVSGDDEYQSGAFAQGYGYWYGVGLIYDGAGDDDYRSIYYSLASGAHYSVGAVVDEAGDDGYRQEMTIPGSAAGTGVAFAWDFVNALLVDKAGTDHYESRGNCLGRSSMKGNALLFDGAGDDTYVSGGGNDCLGTTDWQNYYGADPYRPALTGAESQVISLLVDAGGRDTYLAKDFVTGATSPHPIARDGGQWFFPDPEAMTPLGMSYRDARVFGIGADLALGVVPEFWRIPPAPTPLPAGSQRLDQLLPGDAPMDDFRDPAWTLPNRRDR